MATKSRRVANINGAGVGQLKSVASIDTSKGLAANAVKSAKAGNVIGASSSKKAITKPEEAYDYIVQMGTNLDNEKVPVMNRFVIARPEFVNMLCKDARVLAHANQQVLPNGITAIDVNGMTVVKNNFVPANAVVAMHNSAIGFGRALDEVETYRSQSAFSDVIRGLKLNQSLYIEIYIRKFGEFGSEVGNYIMSKGS